jgi:hypothetical protein
MCLDYLKKIPLKKINGKYYGYKVFRGEPKRSRNGKFSKGLLYGKYYNTTVAYSYDQWYKTQNDSFLWLGGDKGYKCGFHIYSTKKEAEQIAKKLTLPSYINTIRKVEFKGVLATGVEGLSYVIVAKQIRILP